LYRTGPAQFIAGWFKVQPKPLQQFQRPSGALLWRVHIARSVVDLSTRPAVPRPPATSIFRYPVISRAEETIEPAPKALTNSRGLTTNPVAFPCGEKIALIVAGQAPRRNPPVIDV